MAITREVLEKKLAELERAREVHLANANAVSGAIMQVKELLALLDGKAGEPEKEAKS